MDPESVPGILFVNRMLRHNQARIIDIAPTILKHLNVPAPSGMEGASLLDG